MSFFFFFFNDTATTEIYTLSLHDALPISQALYGRVCNWYGYAWRWRVANTTTWSDVVSTDPSLTLTVPAPSIDVRDRKSTRLNSSHANISYAVFCLKKKKYITSRSVVRT